MDAGGDRFSTNVAVIPEIYDSELAHQTFAMELERALDEQCCIIVIEPTNLGDETARWIMVGNCLHKTAVLSGLSAIVTGLVWPDNLLLCCPLAGLSTLCTALYTASWQFDQCVKYQVEKDPRKLARLTVLSAMSATSPVVLVRKDDTKRKILHWTVTLSAATLCAFKLYKSLK